MERDEFTDDERKRESELTETENHCLVCGLDIAWPPEIGVGVRCSRCGADNWQLRPLHVVNIPDLQAEIRERP